MVMPSTQIWFTQNMEPVQLGKQLPVFDGLMEMGYSQGEV